MEPHVVKSYAAQMGRITGSLEEMGGLVADAVRIAGQAVTRRDQMLRQQAKANDKTINALQDEIDRQIAEMFMKQAPMASELRFILSAHSIANALEGAGDLAKNTTKRLVRCGVEFPPEVLDRIRKLVEVDGEMLHAALAAFRDHDEVAARSVWKRDDEADTLCREAYAALIQGIHAASGNEAGVVDALFAVKQFERIADYAVSVAKTVLYVTTGMKPQKEVPEDNGV